jgi:hypothetical protein
LYLVGFFFEIRSSSKKEEHQCTPVIGSGGNARASLGIKRYEEWAAGGPAPFYFLPFSFERLRR